MQDSLEAARQLKTFGIALTGGIGTGKSTVAKSLRARGYTVIDADQLAREVTAAGSAGLAAIVQRFGSGAQADDGSLNRKYLSMRVFKDPNERRALEEITHPLIRAALLGRVAALNLAAKPRPFFYEAALIFETGSAAAYRQVWATYCSASVQKERLMQRDQLTPERAELLIASQMDASEKAQRAEVRIDTSGTLATVEAQIEALLAAL